LAVTFHRLLAQDLRSVLAYYESEASVHLSARFLDEFELLTEEIKAHPGTFHFVVNDLRRANFRTFPYHLLFRLKNSDEVRILVLRHHRRHPEHGLRRK
jgi:plasmid stabilization system protein ParE